MLIGPVLLDAFNSFYIQWNSASSNLLHDLMFATSNALFLFLFFKLCALFIEKNSEVPKVPAPKKRK